MSDASLCTNELALELVQLLLAEPLLRSSSSLRSPIESTPSPPSTLRTPPTPNSPCSTSPSSPPSSRPRGRRLLFSSDREAYVHERALDNVRRVGGIEVDDHSRDRRACRPAKLPSASFERNTPANTHWKNPLDTSSPFGILTPLLTSKNFLPCAPTIVPSFPG